MANYDDDVLGVNNRKHPANEEYQEYSTEQLLEEELSRVRSKRLQLQMLVKKLEDIEVMQVFQITGLSPELEKEYVKTRSELYFKIKH